MWLCARRSTCSLRASGAVFEGVPSPVSRPQEVDMVVFRENTEDLYAGVEFEEGTDENAEFAS